MKQFNFLVKALVALMLFSCNNQPAIKAPVAEKIPHQVFDNRVDNYFWMRLSDDQKNASIPDEQTAKVLDYLDKENKYSKEVLKNTLVMDVNMSAGHGGASGRFERYRITALEYAFILDLAGIKQ